LKTLGLLSDSGNLGLATDLYQLTMTAAYLDQGIGQERATFELFVRRFPGERGYLLCAGLEQALEYLQNLRFDGHGIEYLRSLGVFSGVGSHFWEYLGGFRFTGEVNAIPEGTVVFPNEPLMQITAPLLEAQMVETFLLATLNHQTLIASKAARVVDAAQGRGVIDFGVRRAHGFDAGLFGTRACFIGGCVGTSNVLAGREWGIPVYGTAAHSFTMAFEREQDAFAAFHRSFPQHSTLLIDTYDTLEGARRVVALGEPVAGVRLDSGDMLELSRHVRRILDEGGLQATKIVASGDLEELKISGLLAQGAPIDTFGVGTEMMTSRDAPALGGVYKLVAIEDEGGHRPVQKLSPGKQTYPDVKQVYRHEQNGRFTGDTLALASEPPHGTPLLQPYLRGGKLIEPLPALKEIRERAAAQLAALPEGVRKLRDAETYPVDVSPALAKLAASLHPGQG
jgi:nicotinate phosphoribosyltransferase